MAHFTTSDGISLHFETHGFENAGPALVFLNGLTQTTRHWATHRRALCDERRVLTYDARGQGDSDAPEGVPSLADHVRDLRELLEHLDITSSDLVGFSHGARLALGFATEYPARLRRLVLCSATASPTALARTIVRSWGHILDQGGLAALAWASIPTIIGNEFLEKNEFLLENIVRASVDRNTEQGARMLLEGLARFPELNDLAGKVTAPTLVISADHDPLVDQEGARKLAELCGGTHALVENCGHTIPIEKPDIFRSLIVDFL